MAGVGAAAGARPLAGQEPDGVRAGPTTSRPVPPPFDSDHASAPTAVAVRRSAPIRIDGRLDEAAWMDAPPVRDFWQFEPDEGIPVSEHTEVRFLYDDDALYIGAWLWDRDGLIPTRLGRRDVAMSDTDLFALHLDAYHDHRTSYRFAINPSGARRDQAASGGGSLAGGDGSWNPVWEAETSIAGDGWFVEMRIPFSQLRFPRADEQTWGLQIERKLRPVQENTVWAYTPRSEAQGQGRFGHLTGIRGIVSGRSLEVLPYVSGQAAYTTKRSVAGVSFEDPFWASSDYSSSGGLDLKFRATSNLTLDASVNPDFGQVEADPAVINLTAFETRFDERRPFFIEGAEIFDFGDRTTELLYSRRLGRAPQGSPPVDAIYQSTPGATTILGAGKLTGKTATGWSLGLLGAVTGREEASWINASALEGATEVEPRTSYTVARARREMRAGQTVLGAIATAVRRDLDASPLRSQLHGAAYTGGLDFAHEWSERTWALRAQVSGSLVTGTPEALLRTQQASTRYFQRPDAWHVALDSMATSLAGYAVRATVEKQAGLWRVSGLASAVSPGHEINDIGFQNLADRVELAGSVGYEQVRRGARFLNWSLYAIPSLTWNYGGDRVGTALDLSGSAQLPNYARLGLRLGYSPDRLNGRLTRGGPLARDAAAYRGSADLTTDTRTRLTARAELRVSGDRSGGWERSAAVDVGYKAASTLDVSVAPSLALARSTNQFLTSVADPGAIETFGRRYVFADVRQTTVSMDVRLNLTLTPEISLELFSQPFLSSGDYSGLKELAAPRSRDYLRYGDDVGEITLEDGGRRLEVDPDGAGPAPSFTVGNPDFNVRSLLSNLVLRWEWRPGSTLYAVWQHTQAGAQARMDPDVSDPRTGASRPGHDLRTLFRLPADDIFQIKASVWLNPLG